MDVSGIPVPSRVINGLQASLQAFFVTLVCTNALLTSTNADSLNLPSTVIFQLFPNCHIKFIYAQPEHMPGRINYLISTALDLNISVSNLNVGAIHLLGKNGNLQGTSHNAPHRFAQCFLHVYMEDELTDNGTDYWYLEFVMKSMQHAFMEFPHHFLFLGSFWGYRSHAATLRWQFYHGRLHQIFAKGLIFSVSLDEDFTLFETLLACIICEDTLVEIDVTRVILKELQQHLQLRKESQLSQRPVQIKEWLAVKPIVEKNCDFANPGFRPAFAIEFPLFCLYPVLLSSNNITLQGTDATVGNSVITIIAHGYTTLYSQTLKHQIDDGLQIVSFPSALLPWKYTAFQPKPAFTAALLKPYDLKCWLAAITVLIVLASALSVQTFASCGGCLDSLFVLIRISLFQPRN